MNANVNVFSDDWVECLRAHYMHVIRTRDVVTEPSLTKVLHDVGFSDAELAELRVRATMHADTMPDDFVPDMNVLAEVEAKIYAVPEIPVEAEMVDEPEMLMEADTFDEVLTLEESIEAEAELEAELPLEDEVELAAEIDIAEDEPEDDPDAPQQLSLF